MFRPPELLPFNLAALIQQSIVDWHSSKQAAAPLPETEGVGDFIVAEMDNCLLRKSEGGAAVFEVDATAEEYRRCVFLALDRWLEEIQREPTREERDAYYAFNESWGPTVMRKRTPPCWENQNESTNKVFGVLLALLTLLAIAVILWFRFAE